LQCCRAHDENEILAPQIATRAPWFFCQEERPIR
jgi:hypothetical protein